MKQPARLSVLCAIVLSACAVGPDFKAPDTSATKAYLSEQDVLTAEQRLALGQHMEKTWWTLFGSHTLDDLIRQAVAGNHGLAAARETLAQAKASVDAERGSLLPQVSLDALAGRQKYGVALFGPSNFLIPPFTYYEAGPVFSWTADLFGGGQRRLERQQALTAYQSHELEALYVALTGNVASQTVQLAALHQEIGSAEALIRADNRLLALSRAAVEAGAASRTDVLAAQSRLATDRALLPPLKQRYSLSAHTLSVLLGKTPGDWSPPALPFGQLGFPPTIPLSLPSELAHNRPDILAAEANLHAASATVGVATANLYPDLTLSANLLQEALTPSRIFYGASNAWALVGGLSAPLFNGGSLSAQKQAAEHAYQAALEDYRQTVVHAFGQVADALTALAHDAEWLTSSQESAQTTRDALEIARKSQEAGSSALPEVEAALRSVALAQMQLTEARATQYLDAIQLFVALGGSPADTAASRNSPHPPRDTENQTPAPLAPLKSALSPGNSQ